MWTDIVVIFGFSMIVALSGALVPGPLLTYTVIKTLETQRKGFLVGFWVILGHACIEMAIIIGILMGFSLILTKPIVVRSIGIAGGAFLIYMGLDIIVKIIKKNYKTPFNSNNNLKGFSDETSYNSFMGKSMSNFDSEKPVKTCLPGGDNSPGINSSEVVREQIGEKPVEKASEKIIMCSGGKSRKSLVRISNPVLGGALVSMSNPYWWVWWATVGFGFMLQYRISLTNWQSLTSFYIGHETGDLLWYAAVSTLIFLGRRRINQRFYVTLSGFCGIFIIGFGIFLMISAFLSTATAG